MKVVSSVGLRLISSLLDTGSVEAFTKVNINESTLKPLELEYYEYIKNFVYEHKAVPQKSTMFHELDIASLPSAKEVPSFYANQVRDRFISDEIKRGYTKAASYLQKDTMNVSKAVEKLTKSLLKIHKETNSKNMMDFKHSKDYIAKAYKAKKVLGGDGLVKLGYKTLDILTDGLVGGDLVSIVGSPAMGKTWSPLYTAHHVFNVQDKTVLYVSMEMNMLSIQQRLTSMHTKKNLTQLKKAQLSTLDHDKMLKSLGGLATKKNSLWVVDGNLTATVEDIWKLAMQLSPDLIIVDGAYLLRHPNPRISKFERVSENTEMLKQMVATDLDVPVICSWQFNREATRKLEKNKDAKAGLEDIGYSDAIGQLSSLVLGLTQSESVETLVVREVDILKGRNGETGKFYMNWDFFNMDFSEVNYDPKDKTQGGMQNM
jgi:replicative DNA helicase